MTEESRKRCFCVGEIYLMHFDGSGNEQTGWRPGLIFQNNKGNIYSPNVIALPLTTSIKKVEQPTHVLVSAKDSGLIKDSMVLCENPERMSKERIGRFLTKLPDKYIEKVAVASIVSFGILSTLDPLAMLMARQETYVLNSATPVA